MIGSLLYVVVICVVMGTLALMAYRLSRRQLRTQFKLEAEKLARIVDEKSEAVKTAEEANVAKSAFLANMSHELRTPLNGILGLTDVLSGEELTTNQLRKIKLIQDSSETLLRLLNDILDISKIEASAIEIENLDVDLSDLLTMTFAFWNPIATKKNIDLVFQKQRDLPVRVISDPTRVRQCLDNLINNAIKFTPDGGRICVRASGREIDSQMHVTFSVEDSGIGIETDVLEQLFKPFQQAGTETARKFGGTGLGLVITKNLCMLMGGDVKATSLRGKGTTFEMSIVAEQSLDQTAKEIVHPKEKPTSSFFLNLEGTRCLVVEDNPVNLEVLQLLLEPFKMNLVETVNGMQAIEALETQYFDIVLMDLQMPVMGGLAATQIIRKSESAYCNIPIIAMTANAMKEDRVKSFNAGVDAFLTKPLKRDELAKTISSVLYPSEFEQNNVA